MDRNNKKLKQQHDAHCTFIKQKRTRGNIMQARNQHDFVVREQSTD